MWTVGLYRRKTPQKVLGGWPVAEPKKRARFVRVLEYPREYDSPARKGRRKAARRWSFERGLRSLEQLARGLNAGAARSAVLEKVSPPSRKQAEAENRAWAVAKEIMDAVFEAGNSRAVPVPRTAIERFNTLAFRTPGIFYIDSEAGGGEELLLKVSPRKTFVQLPLWAIKVGGERWVNFGGMAFLTPAGPVLHLLADFFRHPARDRLKRCLRCRRWFVDRTKNKAAKRCSTSCTWKWWDRARRREAGRSSGR